jgi:hypothetical protein
LTQNLDQELIRQILAAVAERLATGDGLHPRKPLGSTVVRPSADGPPRSDDPNIVVIVLGQTGSEPQRAEPQSEVGSCGCASAGSNKLVLAAGSLHPGHEKFPVREESSSDPAPRSCFIEPHRACVNSGACEMRGY